MKIYKNLKFTFIFIIPLFLFSFYTEASTLELNLDKNITSAKEDINVLVSINSEGQDVNTAQATISFPPNLLEVIKIDRTDSVLSFWLEEPNYDNAKGTIRFVGGATNGFTGQSLRVIKISFKVKGSGVGRLGVTDGAITASDGSGSNVYTTSKGLDINIPTNSEFQAVKVERIQKAEVLAKKLPQKPSINIPFYPDPTKWNNRRASFQAKWDIGSDIIKAGVILDNKTNTLPKESGEALTGSKIFQAIDDGVKYLHLRVANNIGWGETLHYRIAVDTTPPTPFKIAINDGAQTNNPKPIINFTSSDITSGIDRYNIYLDGNIVSSTTLNKYQFDPLLPGIHKITVSAVDKAENSVSESENIEILPIASPVINYLSRSVIVDESGITAGGTSLPSTEITIQVQNALKQNVFEQVTSADNKGNWSVVINKSIKIGEYYLSVSSRDDSMASSLPVMSDNIIIKMRPMLVFGSFEITQMWFFIYLIIILLVSFGMGWLSYHNWKGKLDRRITIASRDVMNILDNTKKDINKLIVNYKEGGVNESYIAELDYTLKKIKENLEKYNSYIIDNIREINKK